MNQSIHTKGKSSIDFRKLALEQAQQLGFELVEASLVKEARGRVLSIFIDKPGGITLDDCEKFHKLLQPSYEAIDYDIMEVSSPGVDRPIKTPRDFEKNRGNMVEVHLFSPLNGSKMYTGQLESMDEETVGICAAPGEAPLIFPRKAVSLIKPVIELEEEDFEDVSFENAPEIEVQDDDFSNDDL